MKAEIERRDSARREACRLRRAIRESLARHPNGLTREEILQLLAGEPSLAGTRRNLEFQTRAILQALMDQGRVKKGNGPGAAVYKWTTGRSVPNH